MSRCVSLHGLRTYSILAHMAFNEPSESGRKTGRRETSEEESEQPWKGGKEDGAQGGGRRREQTVVERLKKRTDGVKRKQNG